MKDVFVRLCPKCKAIRKRYYGKTFVDETPCPKCGDEAEILDIKPANREEYEEICLKASL